MKRLVVFLLGLGVNISASFSQTDCTSSVHSESCVTFDVIKHGITNPELYYFLWDFGDGEKGEGGKVTHCYNNSGNYVSRLSLTNKENGAFFENELDLNVLIQKPFEIAINVKDTLYMGDDLTVELALLEGDKSQISDTTWLLNGNVVELDNRLTITAGLVVGTNVVNVKILLNSGVTLCDQKSVEMLPHNDFTYDTRYLEDEIHYINDSLVWSGNLMVANGMMSKLSSVFYQLDDAELSSQAEQIVLNNLKLMNGYNDMKIQIGSFTHSDGDYEQNRKLSLKRSNLLMDFLISKGLSADKITIADPEEVRSLKNTCSDFLDCSFVDKQLNLRTDFKILRLQAP